MAKAQIKHWFEWKRTCALGLCSTDTQSILRQFAHARFRYYTEKFLHRTNLRTPAALSIEERQAWHLFESHLELKTTRAGKAYKIWLLSRANEDGPRAVQALESGASLILRDVVREFMRKELSPPRTVSLARPLNDDFARPMTIADLLPGETSPASKVEMREYSELADGHAGAAFDDMQRRERIAVFCRSMGISLAHHVVTEIAGCRKSSLSNSYRDAITRIASHLQHKYVKEDSDSVKTLTLMTIQVVKERVVVWAKLEKSCARLFKVAEQM